MSRRCLLREAFPSPSRSEIPPSFCRGLSSEFLCVPAVVVPPIDQACIWLGRITGWRPVHRSLAGGQLSVFVAQLLLQMQGGNPLPPFRLFPASRIAYWHPRIHRVPQKRKGGAIINQQASSSGTRPPFVVGSLTSRPRPRPSYQAVPSSVVSIARNGLSTSACCTMQRGTRTDWLWAGRVCDHFAKKGAAPVLQMHRCRVGAGEWGGGVASRNRRFPGRGCISKAGNRKCG